MGYFDKIWFQSFLYLFSLQSGVVLTVVIYATIYTGMLIMSTYTMTVLGDWNTDNIGGIIFSFAHAFFILFGILMALLGAYSESGKKMLFAGILMGIAFLIYLAAMLLSFIPGIYMYACVMYRCPDHIWLQNSHWRTYYFENQSFVCISQTEGQETILESADDYSDDPYFYSQFESNEDVIEPKYTIDGKGEEMEVGNFMERRDNRTVLEGSSLPSGQLNATENSESQSHKSTIKPDTLSTNNGNGPIMSVVNQSGDLSKSSSNYRAIDHVSQQNDYQQVSRREAAIVTVKWIPEVATSPDSPQYLKDYSSSEGQSLTANESLAGPDSIDALLLTRIQGDRKPSSPHSESSEAYDTHIMRLLPQQYHSALGNTSVPSLGCPQSGGTAMVLAGHLDPASAGLAESLGTFVGKNHSTAGAVQAVNAVSTSVSREPHVKVRLMKFAKDENGRIIILYPEFGMFVSILFTLLYLGFLGYTVLTYISFANEIRTGVFVSDIQKYENSKRNYD